MKRAIMTPGYSQEHLTMLSTITRLLDESVILDDALGPLLQAVCSHLSWTVGAGWFLDALTGALRCRCFCHEPDANVASFEMITREMVLSPEESIVGRVWATGQSEWVEDLADLPGFRRALAARRVGLRSGCVLPVWSHGSVRAVLEFYSRESFLPTDEVCEALHVVTGQLGQFLARLDAEQALRESEEHVNALVAHAPVLLFALNRHGIITMSEGCALEALGYLPGENVNHSFFDVYRDAPDLHVAARQALAGKTVTTTVRARGRVLEVHVAPQYASGQVISVTGVATDVTASFERSLDPRSLHKRVTRLQLRTNGK
jgi:PAS domain S-box-containing protein